jgi:hypothetical protein
MVAFMAYTRRFGSFSVPAAVRVGLKNADRRVRVSCIIISALTPRSQPDRPKRKPTSFVFRYLWSTVWGGSVISDDNNRVKRITRMMALAKKSPTY